MMIINALHICKTSNSLSVYVKKYQHIIVDEAQDIDDMRGNLILKYFERSGAKSICILGDPRQRINSNHGGWYVKLWTNHPDYPYQCNRIGFSYSYRFQNRMNLDIANHLSQQRPLIHHKLISHPSVPYASSLPIELCSAKYNELDMDIGMVADYILHELHLKYKIPFSEMAVVGASINKDNATSNLAGKICSVFKDRNLPCYTKQNGSFLPDAILFTTIHSVKGKEFDYVFICGADSFPETFKNIPFESAESLTYVMHTRARKRIYYLSPKRKMFTPPRGLRDPKLDFITHKECITNKPFIVESSGDIFYRISELSKEFSYAKFMDTNDYTLEILPLTHFESQLPRRPSFLDKRFWGIMCGVGVQLALTHKFHDVFELYNSKKYDVYSVSRYTSKVRSGEIVNGRTVSTGRVALKEGIVNVLKNEELTELRLILEKQIINLNSKEIIVLTKVYDFIMSGNTQTRYDIVIDENEYNQEKLEELYSEIRDAYFDLAEKIEREFEPSLGVESIVNDKYMSICGAIDSLHKSNVLEFKTTDRDFTTEDAYQVNMYSLCTGKQPILINLQTGQVCYVTSRETMEKWRYTIRSYTSLRTHVDIVTYRKNKRISQGKLVRGSNTDNYNKLTQNEFKSNVFVLDTEFSSDDSSIFEIAVVNLHDPYRSLVQIIHPGVRSIQDASKWLSEPRILFNDSKCLSQFQALFDKLVEIMSLSTVQLEYYVCKVDVSWCTNSRYPNINKKFFDLSKPIKEDAKKMGYIHAGSTPKLSEYYDLICHPTDYQNHMRVHTALTDTLMLSEIKHLGYV